MHGLCTHGSMDLAACACPRSCMQALENAFKNETVGLVTKADFVKKRTTLQERCAKGSQAFGCWRAQSVHGHSGLMLPAGVHAPSMASMWTVSCRGRTAAVHATAWRARAPQHSVCCRRMRPHTVCVPCPARLAGWRRSSGVRRARRMRPRRARRSGGARRRRAASPSSASWG